MFRKNKKPLTRIGSEDEKNSRDTTSVCLFLTKKTSPGVQQHPVSVTGEPGTVLLGHRAVPRTAREMKIQTATAMPLAPTGNSLFGWGSRSTVSPSLLFLHYSTQSRFVKSVFYKAAPN